MSRNGRPRHDTALPRTEPLIPEELLVKLIDNASASEEQDDFDPFPVVKLFTPDAAATWLLTEAYPEGPDVRLFGLMDLGAAGSASRSSATSILRPRIA